MTIKLSEMIGGGIEEQLQDAWIEVAANIQDPNTKAEAKRKITITIEVKPSKSRTSAECEVKVKPTLVAPNGLTADIVIDRDRKGNIVVEEYRVLPGPLFSEPDEDGVVYQLEQKGVR